MTGLLEDKFLKAYKMASTTKKRFPPDIMLHFYAYYKKATQNNGFYEPRNDHDLRNGFKANALLQIESLSQEEAREKYVEMVERYIGEVH